MSNNFRVGQKVVCITEQWDSSRLYLHSSMPIYGEVYTIRGIYKSPGEPVCGLWLEEIESRIIIDPSDMKAGEAGFSSAHFRPAVERGTDTGMAILTKILLDNLVDA